MSVNLSPLGGAGWQFLDNSGNVLSGGLLYTYSAGTTTPLTTYQDATGTTANANPVVLDAAGRVSGEVWLTAGLNYKLVLKTSTGTTLWTADNISGGTDAAASVLAQLAASGGSSLIGFLQSGTGAVATTVQSKLRETVSVKDFGAVGDGVTDDTTAIQAAIATTKNVFFPSGIYRCGSIVFTQRVNVSGEGMSQTIIVPTSGSGICWDLQFGSGSSATRNSSIQDLTFWNNYPAVPSAYGTGTTVKLSRPAFQLRNVRVIGGEFGVHGAANHYYGVYDNVQFDYSKHLVDASANNACSYKDCIFAGFEIRNAISVNFENVDCSGNMSLGDKQYRIIDPQSVTFQGLYMEFLDTATVGPFTMMSLEGPAYSANNNLSVNINGAFLRGAAVAKISSIILADNVNLVLESGYAFSATQVVKTANNGYVDLRHIARGPTIVNTDAASRVNVTTRTQRTFGPNTDPVTNGVSGTAYNSGNFQIFSTGAAATDFLGQTSKNATAGETRHYGLYSASTLAAHIGVLSNTGLYTRAIGGTNRLLTASYGAGLSDEFFKPTSDNNVNLGAPSERWAVVYAGTGTINTSDEREKQDVADLDAAEKRVAAALRGLVKKFRFKDAVQAKGDNARIHVGVIAQEVMAAFAAEGLDPMRYAIVCYDEWDAEDEILNEDGAVVSPARAAGNRYGVRYEELLAFIISAL